MHHYINGLGADEAFRHIQVTTELIAVCAPGIFGDVIFCTVLVFGNTGQMHQVVVGSDECFETFLTNLRSYFDFRVRLFEFIYFFQTLFLGVIVKDTP